MKLRALDLFSGIGGMSLALRGWTSTVAYCEINRFARSVLDHNAKRNELDAAPICKDIADLNERWMADNSVDARGIDIVLAGFPCTGMSVAGSRGGFENESSALFFEIMRIADIVQPKMLFFENSAFIVSNGLGVIVKELVERRGYALRYTCVAASAVGAPHRRNRWYCLAIKEESLGNIEERRGGDARPWTHYPWHTRPAPARMVSKEHGRRQKKRGEMYNRLGNSVVPDVVRRAFVHLAQGFKSQIDDVLENSVRIEQNVIIDGRWMHAPKYPATGFIERVGDSIVTKPAMRIEAKVRPLDLVLDPVAYRPDVPPHASATSGFVEHPVNLSLWATPTPLPSSANFITQRSKTLIGTQLRFERNTDDRYGYINPKFFEWMMGFPIGWTCMEL